MDNKSEDKDMDYFDKLMQPRWITIHVVAVCDECDFRAENYLTAWDEANDHADQTGHQMTVEKGIVTREGYAEDE